MIMITSESANVLRSIMCNVIISLLSILVIKMIVRHETRFGNKSVSYPCYPTSTFYSRMPSPYNCMGSVSFEQVCILCAMQFICILCMNVLGKNVGFEEKHIMHTEKNGFEVPGGGWVSGDEVWVGCREMSEKFRAN